ncbi:hypothetical protein [Planktothricoides raciborskii]|uniref:Uncharacterized protein n=1 Tax=Planktothricoides raciborskii GIHE-MW2 TaxID=2792601 RepID=A0AAU8JCF9_9CYAN
MLLKTRFLCPHPRLRNRVSLENLCGKTELLLETRFLCPHSASLNQLR